MIEVFLSHLFFNVLQLLPVFPTQLKHCRSPSWKLRNSLNCRVRESKYIKRILCREWRTGNVISKNTALLLSGQRSHTEVYIQEGVSISLRPRSHRLLSLQTDLCVQSLRWCAKDFSFSLLYICWEALTVRGCSLLWTGSSFWVWCDTDSSLPSSRGFTLSSWPYLENMSRPRRLLWPLIQVPARAFPCCPYANPTLC